MRTLPGPSPGELSAPPELAATSKAGASAPMVTSAGNAAQGLGGKLRIAISCYIQCCVYYMHMYTHVVYVCL